MRNGNPSNRRGRWLTAYRYFTVIALTAIFAVVMVWGNILSDRSFAPINTTQASKIERASTFLQNAGFNNPIYLGVIPGVEGEWPTFRAEAIGGEPVDLIIRTTRNGGWEIQPDAVFESVDSAEDFARLAGKAVDEWENMPPDIKPRTDGAFGEYEARKFDFEHLVKYSQDKSFWDIPRDETSGWPRK